jgi:hypothetical protein
MTRTKDLYTIWHIKRKTPVPAEKKKNLLHRYVILAGKDTGIDNDLVTCLPISSRRLNAFSVSLPKKKAPNALDHDSFIFCDHIVTFRLKQLDTYLGYVSSKGIIITMKDTVTLWLDPP